MDFVTTGDAAQQCGVNINTIKRWIRDGRIKAICTPGGHWRIPRDEFERFLAELGIGAQAPQPADARPQQDPVVLIVDDDPLVHELVRESLQGFAIPCRIHSAYDGYTGLLEAGLLRPQLIVLDVMMPEVNGVQFLNRLHAEQELAGRVRVVVLTGVDQQGGIIDRVREAGPDAILFKPLEVERFIETVRPMLEAAETA